MKAAEPRLVYDPREYEAAYVSALEMSGGYSARLNFSFFNALTELPDHAGLDVGDITDEVHSGVIEVKTPSDLTSSAFDDEQRLWRQMWRLFLLRTNGKCVATAVLVRDIHAPQHEKTAKMWLPARQFLFSHALNLGHQVLFSEGVDDTIKVATSWLRKCREAEPPRMNPPAIKKEWLEHPMTVRVLCMVPGIGIGLATQVATQKSLWDIIIDAHEMDVEGFCVLYANLYNFGGKENKRLKSIYNEFHELQKIQKEVIKP